MQEAVRWRAFELLKLVANLLIAAEIFTALADLITEFLEIISHTILFNFGGYPAETFSTTSYQSILIHRCKVKEITDYVDATLRTVHRWIKCRKLCYFAACIIDKDDNIVLEAMINIIDVHHPHLTSHKLFEQDAVDLKRQFQQTIFMLQREAYIENLECDSLNKGKFKWEKCDQRNPSDLRPCGNRIDNKLIEV
ncbi:unnamed protein product [Thelazia callipaeda]|uniref:HORMA domain-containing protein n=1 Tax=Thelazia callipaeda TaxID=103827 RepID=A0A0N5D1J8_THECL|nr:unnamed protein product [Thelazia callipaeda]